MSVTESSSRGPHWWEGPAGTASSAGGRPAPPPPRPHPPAGATGQASEPPLPRAPAAAAARTAEPPLPRPPAGEPPLPRAPAAEPARTAEPPTRVTRRPPVLALAVAACVVAPPLVLLDAPAWARFPAVLLVLALAPGTAALCVFRLRLETGLAVGVSLAVSVAIAEGMLWAGAWNPKLFACLLAGACLACMAGARLMPPRRKQARRPGAATATPPRGGDLVRRRGRPARPAPERVDGPREAAIPADPTGLGLAPSALLALDRAAGSGERGEQEADAPPLVLRPAPRRFSPEYKLRILRAAEACTSREEVMALLRREGLRSSHLRAWRKKRDEGALSAPVPEPGTTGGSQGRAFGLPTSWLGRRAW
jgi:transposase-like protein